MDGQEGRGLMSRAWTVPCSQQSTEDSGYLAWRGGWGVGGTEEVGMVEHSYRSTHTAMFLPMVRDKYGKTGQKQKPRKHLQNFVLGPVFKNVPERH